MMPPPTSSTMSLRTVGGLAFITQVPHAGSFSWRILLLDDTCAPRGQGSYRYAKKGGKEPFDG